MEASEQTFKFCVRINFPLPLLRKVVEANEKGA